MMASPEWYYEEYLKGKSADQIRSRIRSLQRKIRRLEKMAADPEAYQQERICPSLVVQLELHRMYLQKANEALMDAVEYLESEKPEDGTGRCRPRKG